MWKAAPQQTLLQLPLQTGHTARQQHKTPVQGPGLGKAPSRQGAAIVLSLQTLPESKTFVEEATADAEGAHGSARDDTGAARARPPANAAWGALGWRGGRRRGWKPACGAGGGGAARGGMRLLQPCGSGIPPQVSNEGPLQKVTVVSTSERPAAVTHGVDELYYIDAPVWRRRNGEVLVGRDVLPFVGMRVVMARQVSPSLSRSRSLSLSLSHYHTHTHTHTKRKNTRQNSSHPTKTRNTSYA